MRTVGFFVLANFLLSGAAGRAFPQEKPEGKKAQDERHLDREAVAKHFKGHCQPCHAVPDPAQEYDRAWLDQIHRTA
jgi:mono/diheme cytochrome c family protein